MRTVIVIDEEHEMRFRSILERLKHCPRCHAAGRRIEGQFIISQGASGEIYSSANISLICDDCRLVRNFRKFKLLTGYMAEGFKKLLSRLGDA